MKRILLSTALVLIFAGLLAGGASAQSLDPVPYRIQQGDTLASIAQQFCTTWQDVYRYNAGYIGDDPSALSTGTLIFVIDRCDPNTVYDRGPSFYASGTVDGNSYVVAAGDTLYSIGRRFGLNHQTIMEANGLSSTAVIYPGTRLVIPGLSVGYPQPSISITSPTPGTFYLRPYVVQGTGQSLYENNVVVRLLDANGNLMGQQITVMQSSSVGGQGTWQVSFPNVYAVGGTTGRVEAFNPETGATAETYVYFGGY